MQDLENTHNKVFMHFNNGGFITRRSERYWADLPNDLVIEQVLMRSLKTTGGFTRGSGISDVQRAIWLLSKPISLEYGTRMEALSNVLYVTSEQHKTATPSRLKCDREKFQKIQEKLKEFSPFSDDNTLRNIINGVVADKNVNVDDCFKIGSALINIKWNIKVFRK